MTRFHNPLAKKQNNLRAKSSDIKAWVNEALDIDENVSITVAELACRDENCPDVETVIGILEPGSAIQTVRIHASMKDIFKEDVVEVILRANHLA